jgi:hypothetical protein
MNEDPKNAQPLPTATAIAERLQEKPKTEVTFPPLPGIGIDLITLGRFLVQCGYFQDVKSLSQAAVKVLLGQELGIPPIRAMMDVYLVSGRPALGSSLMAAKIKGSQRYNYRIVQHTEEICEIHFFERGIGGAWDSIGVSVFTIADAERAGLVKKGGAWTNYRRNMLFARAVSNGARWHTPDLFGGAVYTPEELDERPERPAKTSEEPATPAGSAVEALAAELEKIGPDDVAVTATHTPQAPDEQGHPPGEGTGQAAPPEGKSTGTLFDGPVGPTPEMERKRRA